MSVIKLLANQSELSVLPAGCTILCEFSRMRLRVGGLYSLSGKLLSSLSLRYQVNHI